jgi:hypothetical protein
MRLCCCIFVLLVGRPWQTFAHQDPQGDIHPVVSVKEDQFEVTFQHKPISESEELTPRTFAITYSKDGQVILPRHAVPAENADLNFPSSPVKKYPPRVEFKFPGAVEQASPAFLVAGQAEQPGKRVFHAVWVEDPFDDILRTEKVLPLEVSAFFPHITGASKRGDQIAVTWSTSQALHESEVSLKLSVIPRLDGQNSQTLDLGQASAFYSNPMATAPLWAADRWWIGWLNRKESSSGEDLRPQMMLSCYDPKSGKVVHKAISGPCYWITSLSIATTSDWLCLAWHGPSSTPPFASQIATAFEKLPGPSP